MSGDLSDVGEWRIDEPLVKVVVRYLCSQCFRCLEKRRMMHYVVKLNSTHLVGIYQLNMWDLEESLQAAKSMSSVTRIAPDMIKPNPKPGNMYALFA